MNTTSARKVSVRDRILIMGSEPGWGENLVSVFENAGFSVARVQASVETVVRPDVLKPDMVILDEDVTNSMDVCFQYATSQIPVILVGDEPGQEIWRKALEEAGADFYLRKPFDHEILIARVKAILRRYKKRRTVDTGGGCVP